MMTTSTLGLKSIAFWCQSEYDTVDNTRIQFLDLGVLVCGCKLCIIIIAHVIRIYPFRIILTNFNREMTFSSFGDVWKILAIKNITLINCLTENFQAWFLIYNEDIVP